ncbi:MAG: magnesium-translocating P-type ATPase [Candidatus Obscuribacterales bacterium]|nr:magnesium-translocating P-type ATPase [Candidatus Obscuribacterales bacterium]
MTIAKHLMPQKKSVLLNQTVVTGDSMFCAKSSVKTVAVEAEVNILKKSAVADVSVSFEDLGSSINGLSSTEVERRLKQYGLNVIAENKEKTWFERLVNSLSNPLVLLLSLLASVSLLTGDLRSAIMMLIMIVLGVSLRYFQEWRADNSAAKLKAMVSTKTMVLRDGQLRELPIQLLVPGDIVTISAGDIVPADIRLIYSKDLFVNQAALTGESLPAEKSALVENSLNDPLMSQNLCFLGTHVEIGSAKGIVLSTGGRTYFGTLAKDVTSAELPTSFDLGIDRLTWLIVKLIVAMVLSVFVINGIMKHDWLQAFLFALAVGVGLTPEMLPMIVSVNLSKGALLMSGKKVIVKRLDAIQNLGAMDVLCTDKTGTLTQGKVILVKHINLNGEDSNLVFNYAFLNSFYQTGLKNMMDMAVLEHEDFENAHSMKIAYKKIDEIPFDFERRRMSVVVEDAQNSRKLICKGSVEEVLALCSKMEINGKNISLDRSRYDLAKKLAEEHNDDGFRVVALAIKDVAATQETYAVADESNMTLLGLLAFLDPPKDDIAESLNRMAQLGVHVKVLTGDNSIVTKRVCIQIGLPVDSMITGAELDLLSETQLVRAVAEKTIFTKLSPMHKERIIHALQKQGHVVGFLGDGINDAPALRSADVGISVDTGVDIAKESASMILLEKNLFVLTDGIIEGRKVFCNILKYIKMAASSNFGNVLSVLGASIFLPFLPMLPIQILTNNLLYDFSQITIPTDKVDSEWLTLPRKWELDEIKQFIIRIGPISSIFDYLTFFMLIFSFNALNDPTLFHTGWFVESLLTQTLIIHVIRTNKIPFIESRASIPLLASSSVMVLIAIWLPTSPLADSLGFKPMPASYWWWLCLLLMGYATLTQRIKNSLMKQ